MAIRDQQGNLVEVLAYCETCKTWTNHVKIVDRFYCACGDYLLALSRLSAVIESE